MYILTGCAAIVASYAVASLTLFRYPTIVHRTDRPRRRQCRHISHRGGAGENYENTLAAFRHAVNLGTDMLELDCHFTKDNQVVVNHDSSLYRTTDLQQFVRDLNYDQLPLLKTKIPIHFEPGSCFTGGDAEDDRKIPLLRDVFKAFPDTHINIDVKQGSIEMIEEVERLIVEYNRQKLTVWGSSNEEINMNCFNKNSDVGLFFSYKGVAKLYLYFYTGLLPFVKLKETHLEIPLPYIFLKLRAGTGKLTAFQKCIGWIGTKLMMRPSLFKHLEKRGIETYLWVLNCEEDFQTAVDLGVAGIMTDYPSKLKNFFEQ